MSEVRLAYRLYRRVESAAQGTPRQVHALVDPAGVCEQEAGGNQSKAENKAHGDEDRMKSEPLLGGRLQQTVAAWAW